MFFIYDCYGNIVGNPKGYRTIKGADKEANRKKGKTFETIWNNFNQKQDEQTKAGLTGHHRDNLIYSIE